MGIKLTHSQGTKATVYDVTGEGATGEEWQGKLTPERVTVELRRTNGADWIVDHVEVAGRSVLANGKSGKSEREHYYGGSRIAQAPPFAQEAIADALASTSA